MEKKKLTFSTSKTFQKKTELFLQVQLAMEEEEVEEASRVERIIKSAPVSASSSAAASHGEENPTDSTRKLLVKW